MATGRGNTLTRSCRCAWLISLSLLVACSSKSQNPKPELPSAIYYTPAWSPDGSEIVSQVTRYDDSGNASYYITVVDATTGEVRRERTLDFPAPFDFSWTPDGEWLLFGAGPGIFKMSSDLQTVIQLTSGQFQTSPSLSKARNLVFFTVNNGAHGGLFSVTLDGDSLQRWSTAETIVAWTSAFPDSSDSLAGFDTKQLPFRLIVFDPDSIQDATFLGIESLRPYPCRVSPSRRFLAYNDEDPSPPFLSIYLLDRADGSTRRLVVGAGEGIDFSPDGSKLVYPVIGGEIGLWIVDTDSGHRSLLTEEQSP